MKKIVLGLIVGLTVVALLAAPTMAAGKGGRKENQMSVICISMRKTRVTGRSLKMGPGVN
jgi:hypothetical protein